MQKNTPTGDIEVTGIENLARCERMLIFVPENVVCKT